MRRQSSWEATSTWLSQEEEPPIVILVDRGTQSQSVNKKLQTVEGRNGLPHWMADERQTRTQKVRHRLRIEVNIAQEEIMFTGVLVNIFATCALI